MLQKNELDGIYWALAFPETFRGVLPHYPTVMLRTVGGRGSVVPRGALRVRGASFWNRAGRRDWARFFEYAMFVRGGIPVRTSEFIGDLGGGRDLDVAQGLRLVLKHVVHTWRESESELARARSVVAVIPHPLYRSRHYERDGCPTEFHERHTHLVATISFRQLWAELLVGRFPASKIPYDMRVEDTWGDEDIWDADSTWRHAEGPTYYVVDFVLAARRLFWLLWRALHGRPGSRLHHREGVPIFPASTLKAGPRLPSLLAELRQRAISGDRCGPCGLPGIEIVGKRARYRSAFPGCKHFFEFLSSVEESIWRWACLEDTALSPVPGASRSRTLSSRADLEECISRLALGYIVAKSVVKRAVLIGFRLRKHFLSFARQFRFYSGWVKCLPEARFMGHVLDECRRNGVRTLEGRIGLPSHFFPAVGMIRAMTRGAADWHARMCQSSHASRRTLRRPRLGNPSDIPFRLVVHGKKRRQYIEPGYDSPRGLHRRDVLGLPVWVPGTWTSWSSGARRRVIRADIRDYLMAAGLGPPTAPPRPRRVLVHEKLDGIIELGKWGRWIEQYFLAHGGRRPVIAAPILWEVTHERSWKGSPSGCTLTFAGFDACGVERYSSPCCYAHFSTASRPRFLTFHAGEDFRHPVVGLRRVFEAVHLLRFRSQYVRIGHAVAAFSTRHPARLVEERFPIYGIDLVANAWWDKNFLEKDGVPLHALSRGPGHGPGGPWTTCPVSPPQNVLTAYDAIVTSPAVLEWPPFLDVTVGGDALYSWLCTRFEERFSGESAVDAFLRQLYVLQLLKQLAANPSLTLEACVTSNWRVIGERGVADHWIFLAFLLGLPVVVNTDDGGILDVDLRGEFDMIYKHWRAGIERAAETLLGWVRLAAEARSGALMRRGSHIPMNRRQGAWVEKTLHSLLGSHRNLPKLTSLSQMSKWESAITDLAQECVHRPGACLGRACEHARGLW